MHIKIVAAIVDTKQLTLYRDDGESIVILQGDPRLRTILDEVTPQIVRQGYAEIEITAIAIANGYKDFEKQSGVVKFFKVAREKLAGLFAPAVESAVVGKKPKKSQVSLEIKEEGHITGVREVPGPTLAAIDEIMAHAVPVTDPSFNTHNLRKQGNIEDNGKTDQQRDEVATSHTIVAQIGGKLVPNVERIESHFIRAAKLGSTIGVENFLRRCAAVMDERSHSVEDLLKFMERSDMTVAEDGSIIIYKVLKRKDDHYVDCHSGKVPQKVGSYVCMDISLVDRHRNNECSNGLHVARRGYLKSFSGDVCTIAKLAPEDVVTVPTYDANKMRVMGYHILHELSPELYALLTQNKPITDLQAGKNLLGRILAGHHVGRLEEVRITQQHGGGIVITPLKTVPLSGSVAVVFPKPAKVAPAEALANPEKEREDKPVDPKAVSKNVTSLTRKEQAQKLYQAYQKRPTDKNKATLIAFKKSVKLGWKALGIDDPNFT